MPSYIVGRRVVKGWRRNKNDPRNEASKGSPEISEEDDLRDGRESREETSSRERSRAKRTAFREEDIRFVLKAGHRFILDCAKALTIITARPVYTGGSGDLYVTFTAALWKLVNRGKGGVTAEFTEVATGVIPGRKYLGTFLKLQRGAEQYALPVEFRKLCRSAISGAPRKSSSSPSGKKKRRRTFYDD